MYVLLCLPLQAVINHLRKHSHAATYAAPISAPVAQQVISSMKIIMGEDGTKEGSMPVSVCNYGVINLVKCRGY